MDRGKALARTCVFGSPMQLAMLYERPKANPWRKESFYRKHGK